jgi:hypothetical protein
MATLNVFDSQELDTGSEIPSQIETMGGSGVLPSPTRGETESMLHDAPLPEVNTSGSAEGSFQIKELMELCTKLL